LAVALSFAPKAAWAQSESQRSALIVSGSDVSREQILAWQTTLMREGMALVADSELQSAIQFSGKAAADLTESDLQKLRSDLKLKVLIRIATMTGGDGNIAVKLTVVGDALDSRFLSSKSESLESDVAGALRAVAADFLKPAIVPAPAPAAAATPAPTPTPTAATAPAGNGQGTADLTIQPPTAPEGENELLSSAVGITFGTTIVEELDTFVGISARGCTVFPKRTVRSTANKFTSWCLAAEVGLNYGYLDAVEELEFWQFRVLAGAGYLIGTKNTALSVSLSGGAAQSTGTIYNYNTDMESEFNETAFVSKIATHGRFKRFLAGLDIYFGDGGQVGLNIGVAL
jgi:hypothetical protein